jgi:hypothetical protein
MGITRMALAVSLIALSANGAFAADWKLVEVAGVVRIAAPGKAPGPASANQVLPVGSIVTTAAGGRAALFNGAQRITLGPNSRMTVAPESNAGMTRVMQDLGSILFQIDKKPSQHFRVETPLLAAVVKGTTFTVNVEIGADSVHVAEGLVEVHANQGGSTRDVGAGATGMVSKAAPEQLNVEVPRASTEAPVAVQAVSLDYGLVSGGLVDGPAAAGATATSTPSTPSARAADSTAPTQADSLGGANPVQASTATVNASLASSGDVAALPNPGSSGNGTGSDSGSNNGNGTGNAGGNGNGGSNGNGNGNNGTGTGTGTGSDTTGSNNGNGNGNAGGNGNGGSNGNGNGNTGTGTGTGTGSDTTGSNSGNGNGNAGGNGNGGSNGNGNNGNGNGNGGPKG